MSRDSFLWNLIFWMELNFFFRYWRNLCQVFWLPQMLWSHSYVCKVSGIWYRAFGKESLFCTGIQRRESSTPVEFQRTGIIYIVDHIFLMNHKKIRIRNQKRSGFWITIIWIRNQKESGFVTIKNPNLESFKIWIWNNKWSEFGIMKDPDLV